MLEGYVIADAVVHGYNWLPENFAIPTAATIAEAGGGHIVFSPDPRTQLTKEEFLRDWQPEDIAEALFIEGQADFVAYHGTPIYDYFIDGHSATDKGVRWKREEPDRVLLYGAANPLDGRKALDQLSRNRDDGADAVKVYAAFFKDGKTIPVALSDAEYGIPFIERSLELGYRTMATHKAIPLGPVSPTPFAMGDLPEACFRYPEMNFEIVHGGFAFVEETAQLLAAFPNIWVNLESANSLILGQPRRFAQFMGEFLLAGAADRIMVGTGTPLVHPRPVYEAIINFEMPKDLMEGYGYPQVTPEMKRGLLGENFLRLHGRDVTESMDRIRGDAWSQRQASTPSSEPWTHARARFAAQQEGH